MFYGVVFTLIPLIVVRQGFRRQIGRWQVRVLIVVAVLIVAAPNLMTLGIAWGRGSGAHAGSRILDVDAPGFRGATLIGFLFAAAVFGATQFFLADRRRRHRGLTALRGGKQGARRANLS